MVRNIYRAVYRWLSSQARNQKSKYTAHNHVVVQRDSFHYISSFHRRSLTKFLSIQNHKSGHHYFNKFSVFLSMILSIGIGGLPKTIPL